MATTQTIMKKIITVFVSISFVSFLMISCSGSSSKEVVPNNKEEVSSSVVEEKSSDGNGDCDKFIKDYEEFVNNYIVVLKKFKENPSDMTIITQYSEMAAKAANMETDAKDCTDPKYITKVSELVTRLSKAVSELQ